MKKVFLAVALLVSAATFATPATHAVVMVKSGDGQHIPASQVPAAVRASFASSFPNATNISWEREREHGHIEYKADFMIGNQRWEARFLADGTLVRQRRK